MSALPYDPLPSSPYRLGADQGPQTVRELRAALAAVSPADLVRFNEALDTARLDTIADVITEYRHVWALRTRPEAARAVADSLNGSTDLTPAAEVFARYGLSEPAA